MLILATIFALTATTLLTFAWTEVRCDDARKEIDQ